MKWKRVCGVLIVLLFLFILGSVSVMASDLWEEKEELGSITIKLEDTKENLSKANVHFVAAKIANLVKGEFVLCDQYANIGINLNQIQTANELANAAAILEALKPEGKEEITDADGIVVMENLPVGVYLVYASDNAEYEDIAPALVSIPTWDEEAVSMIYDIEMLPKHSPFPEIPKTPQTGDENDFYNYVTTTVGALIVAGFCVMVKRKEKAGTLQKK